MNASVQRSGKLLLGPPPTKRAASCRSAAAGRPNLSEIPRPQAWQGDSPSIEITEDDAEYQIIVPLSGVDPRKIYVLATSQSLLIEIRFKLGVCHELDRAPVMESIDKRISREFTLPVEIEQGGTTVEIRGGSLLITARKSEQEQESPWSQLIHFDTRAGLGLV